MLLLRIAAAMMICLAAALPVSAGEWPPAAADLSVSLTRADGGCLEGNDCRLAMQIENLGSAPFKGALRVIIETATPSVPGSIDTEEGTCERLAYGRMACATEALDLAPSETMTGLISVRFLPTVMSEVEACASIDWPSGAGPVAQEAQRSVAAALGKEAALAAVFGTWGKGDLRKGNDRGCVTIAIGPAAAEAQCPAGQGRIAGRCMALDDFCSGERARDKATGNCACPAATPAFDPVKRVCASAAALTCDGGRSPKNGLCFCPEGQPLWNAGQSRCEALPQAKPEAAAVETKPVPPAAAVPPPAAKPQVKAAVEAEAEPPPMPAARPKIVLAPEPKVKAPVKKRAIATPSCDRGETWRGDKCVKIARKAAKRPKQPVRVARRGASGSGFVWAREANKCPPILVACWAVVIHKYRKHKRRLRNATR